MPEDIFEAWKGAVQKMEREHRDQLDDIARSIGVGSEELVSGTFKSRVRKMADNEHFYAEGHRKAEEAVERLRGGLQDAWDALERLHVPRCARQGLNCPACDGQTELEGLM